MAEAAKVPLCDPKPDVDLSASLRRGEPGSADGERQQEELTRRSVTKRGRETAP
jgi:hypothetical protein